MLHGATIIHPEKKPRGGKPTRPKKAANHAIASIRIRIDHAISGMKSGAFRMS
jgi:uncharacterized protein (DUF849 family)